MKSNTLLLFSFVLGILVLSSCVSLPKRDSSQNHHPELDEMLWIDVEKYPEYSGYYSMDPDGNIFIVGTNNGNAIVLPGDVIRIKITNHTDWDGDYLVKSDGSIKIIAGTISKSTYILQTDDVIKIYVEQHPEWGGEYIINPDGKIMIMGLGEIKVSNLTKSEFEESFARYLMKYVNNPRIYVDIVKYVSQSVYILGEVSRPGKYSTQGKVLTLKDAIVIAGLPGRYASDTTVFVISPSKNGKPIRKVVNLYRILYRGELKNNIELKPDDIVYIPKNFWGIIKEALDFVLSPLTNGRAGIAAATAPLP